MANTNNPNQRVYIRRLCKFTRRNCVLSLSMNGGGGIIQLNYLEVLKHRFNVIDQAGHRGCHYIRKGLFFIRTD